MAFRLEFSARALREMGEAHDWYELQSPGLGEEFLVATEYSSSVSSKRLCCMLRSSRVSVARYYRDFRMACSTRFEAIWCMFWRWSTMRAIPGVGPKPA